MALASSPEKADQDATGEPYEVFPTADYAEYHEEQQVWRIGVLFVCFIIISLIFERLMEWSNRCVLYYRIRRLECEVFVLVRMRSVCAFYTYLYCTVAFSPGETVNLDGVSINYWNGNYSR